MIRVRIKAASPVASAGMQRLLQGYPQFQVLDEFADRVEADSDAQPDVVLADEEEKTDRPHPTLNRSAEQAPTVLLLRGSAAERADAFRDGARAVLPAHASGAQIAAAIEAVAAGLGVFDASEMEALLPPPAADGLADPLPEPLTPREIEVLRAMAEGLANKEIASRLGVSENTAKFHVASVMGKLGAASRTEAVMIGIRHGIILI